MNKVMLTGKLKVVPAERTRGEYKFTELLVETSEKNAKGETKIQAHPVQVWGQPGADILGKPAGTRVFVVGKASSREHEGKHYVNIQAQSVDVLPEGATTPVTFESDDLPF